MIEKKLVDFVNQKVSLEAATKWLGLEPESGYAHCPYCGSKEKTLLLLKGAFYCTECHEAGNVVDITDKVKGCGNNEEKAVGLLQSNFGFRVIQTAEEKNAGWRQGERARAVATARKRIASGKRIYEGDRELVQAWDEEQKKAQQSAPSAKDIEKKYKGWLAETTEKATGAMKIYANIAYSDQYGHELASKAQPQLKLLERAVDDLKSEKGAQALFHLYATDPVILRAIKTYDKYNAIQEALDGNHAAEVATHIVAPTL